jgi:hypothetical protein
MHRIFAISEILLLIIEYATADPEALLSKEVEPWGLCETRRTAFRLALTCKTFLPFALDRQWRNINSIHPLLGVLPADFWSVEIEPLELSRPHASRSNEEVSCIHSVSEPYSDSPLDG